MICDIDSGLVKTANDYVLQMLGYSREELFEKTWTDITPKEFIGSDQQHLKSLADIGNIHAPFEKEYIAKGNETP